MDYHSQKATRCCAYAPAASAHQAFFSLLPPRAKLQFPGGSARSGLEVGSLEVTRATEAGGVSSGRFGVGRRGRGAREAGSRTPRYVALGVGAASLKDGRESVSIGARAGVL